jgi:hypothetical protein
MNPVPCAVLLSLLCLGHAPVAAAGLPTGDEVMRRVNARSRGGDSRMRLEMTLHDEKRGDFHKSILLFRKRFETGYRTIYRVTAPAHEEGIGLLLSEDAAQRGMWMYFPISKQLVRVATRGLSALASDFSCEDLRVGVPLSDYRFRTLKRETVEGRSLLQVEMTPRDERLSSELGFTKSIGWVREDLWLIVRADYYDETGKVFKTFRAEDLVQTQGIWTVLRFTMRSFRARHGTEVRVTEVDYGVKFPNDRLTPDRLGSEEP